MAKKMAYRKVEAEWIPPLFIESINDKTVRKYVRTITPNTHDPRTWYVYVCVKAPMITMGNGKKRRGSSYGKESRLLKDDIWKMNYKYFKLTWT